MTLVGLLVILIIVGVVLYLIQLIPMDATIKKIIWVLVILCVILWVLSQFGLLHDTGIRLR
jgi:hypothetical protein